MTLRELAFLQVGDEVVVHKSDRAVRYTMALAQRPPTPWLLGGVLACSLLVPLPTMVQRRNRARLEASRGTQSPRNTWRAWNLDEAPVIQILTRAAGRVGLPAGAGGAVSALTHIAR